MSLKKKFTAKLFSLYELQHSEEPPVAPTRKRKREDDEAAPRPTSILRKPVKVGPDDQYDITVALWRLRANNFIIYFVSMKPDQNTARAGYAGVARRSSSTCEAVSLNLYLNVK